MHPNLRSEKVVHVLLQGEELTQFLLTSYLPTLNLSSDLIQVRVLLPVRRNDLILTEASCLIHSRVYLVLFVEVRHLTFNLSSPNVQ